ncbi:hypothetical protein A2154_02945 [Candidatus Gottesmanbacteria bacterium RBG_16_43_7]|uniref:Type 4 fimbrial biogenesis protein PilX N-terminal domain-containing protein n=1 Tax=Candidatus Gottesmanbacteria bacterium RBG_16_43_7 TaxID=1798373 RepID=A0A1F5Z976_9BACT|nr:MAG: hypothetical protein A2154_02945 [Candidatus Gottesmanbacteria bacterium RBG_16_43_7]
MKKRIHHSGGVSILVLILGVTISIIISGLVLTASTLVSNSQRNEAFEKSLSLAQAGIEYYRWHLAHDQNDLTDGTGGPGPYIHTISDPGGNSLGSFSLQISPPPEGSRIVTLTSQGWVHNHPEIKRTIVAKFGIPALTKYSFVNNSNMWFGDKDEIIGPVYSTGGIRMDGTHDSTVESARSTYTCGLETGCDPSEEKPGVWGSGGPQELWRFPSSPIDYDSISLSYTDIKSQAQTNGLYLIPSGSYGYHIIFDANGTYSVYRITNMRSKEGWSVEGGCEDLFQEVRSETFVGTYAIAAKPVIFAEDYLFVEGTINGKVTAVAAKFPLDTNSMNIWILNNLVYSAKDGSSNLGLIAQNDIIFALDIPNEFEIDGALFAHKGKVIRHNYKECHNYPHAVRSQFILYGSIISNLKSYWSYGQGPGYEGGPTSGFVHRDLIYSPDLYEEPPSFFPTLTNWDFISWEEQ